MYDPYFLVYGLLYCILMIEPLVHVILPIPCLVYMNSYFDYMRMRVYIIFWYICNILVFEESLVVFGSTPSLITYANCHAAKTKSRKRSLQKWKSPLALWPLRGVTSTELKRRHISDRLPSLASFRFWEDGCCARSLFRTTLVRARPQPWLFIHQRS